MIIVFINTSNIPRTSSTKPIKHEKFNCSGELFEILKIVFNKSICNKFPSFKSQMTNFFTYFVNLNSLSPSVIHIILWDFQVVSFYINCNESFHFLRWNELYQFFRVPNLITLFEKSWKKWSCTYQFYPLNNNNNNIIYLEFKEFYTWIIPLVPTQGRVHIFYVLCCKVM